MNPSRFALSLACFLSSLLLHSPIPDLSAQEEASAEKKALTYQRYPNRFNSSYPLRPDSPLLLEFSAAVSPSEVPKFFRFYDKPNERFAAIEAKRPSEREVQGFLGIERAAEAEIDRLVFVRPAVPLPLGGTWYLHARQGFAAADGHEIVESRLDYIGSLHAFGIEEIATKNNYNEPLEIRIRHNKSRLAEGFDDDHVAGFVSIEPSPKDLEVKTGNYGITLAGSFEYGIDYQVTVRDGLVAYDTTRLERGEIGSVRFEPNEGFITLPAFATTQNASGHRRFDVKTGNLTGLRTRVKRPEGDELILALREYNEKYEGWGEKQALPFSTVPGRTIYDEFRESDAEVDETEIISLDWNELTGGATTGAFYLCTEGRSSTRDKLEVGAHSLIQLTDIGLAWKQSEEGTTIYAFSLESGEPLADTEVRLVDREARPLAEAKTGASGTAFIEGEVYREREADADADADAEGTVDEYYLDTRRGGDRHVIRFYEELGSMGLWSFRVDQRWDDILDGERRTLLFTDRNVYRPGDEVKVKAISRFIDADKLLGPGSGAAVMRVYDSRHRKILDREVTLGENGSFDDDFTLPSAGMGWHSIELDFNPPEAEHSDWRLIAHHSFQVEDYRVNTFEVTLDAEDAYTFGDRIEIPVSAKYYMGKPLSKAEMQWNLYAYGSYPRPRGFDEFEFGDLTVDRESHSDEGTEPLSSGGLASVMVELPEQDMTPGPRHVSLTAQVTDANQQTLSSSTSFTVHSSDFYLGLRKPDGVHRAGDTSTFSLAAVSTGGEAWTEEVAVTVLVEKEIWNTVKVMGANGRVTHRNDRRLQMVSEETIALRTAVDPETGLTRALPHEIEFEEAGDFLVTLTARDGSNRPVLTRDRFTVIGAEEPSWSWYDVIRIDLVPDKETYAIGDTAKLLARTPVFGHALLTTERGGVRSTRSLEIDSYETVIEVPIGEGDAPNVFASLLVVRGSGESPHIHTSADYRLGYCRLDVDDPSTALEVAIDAGEPEYYQPGEKVEVTATVLDHEGNGVAGAEVTFFAVDEGVLSLTGHRTPDPHDLFHAAFPLSVFTGQSISDLLPENPQEQEFGNKGYVIGGGGRNNGLDPDRVRKDFKALAFWEPSLVTGADGVTRATFVAPDNLTEFRIMAVVAEGNRFGHAEEPVVINKPLIIEPALPVFTNVTDQVDVSAVLHNNTSSSQEIEVTVALDDHAVFVKQIGDTVPTTLGGADEETLRTVKAVLDPGATETLSFPIALTAVGEAKWNWKVRSLTEERLRDATESTTKVGYPLPLLRESHSFTLRDGESLGEALHAVAPRLLEGKGSIEVTLSNSRLIGAGEALDYLLRYPYGCVEQTTSSLVPWLSTQQLRPVMPRLDKSKEEVEAVIGKGIERLLSMQTGDGGLGYWPGASQSVLWGSAYGGVAIALAQQQGIEVPEEQAAALWKYLAKNLRNTSELKKAYDLSQRCLASYTLALAGVNETSYHDVLFEKRRELSGEARALLALAMIESGTDTPERVEALLAADEKVPVAEVSWYRQPYIVATRLLAQVRHDPKSDSVGRLVDDLMKLRGPRNGWGSTYSNAWPLIALSAYSEATSDSLAANDVVVAFGGEKETVALPAEPGSGAASFSFDGAADRNALSLEPAGSTPVYATVKVETRPRLMPIEPENQGFSIERTYEKVEVDGSITEAEDLVVGDLILVTLDVNIPNERETYLAIDDALPAIFEAVNPTFKTQATQRVNSDRERRRLYTNYREIRKDRVLFFADTVFRAGDYSLQYLARVVAPGQVTAPPAKIEAMYEPQRFGLSGTGRITAGARELGSGRVAVATRGR